ncbi:MAG TPA: hypothetical protein VG944_02410 [Fimbriimonas sp.]|nr:hypothetical protein [Fimbriimonas sp.]
MPPRQRLSPLAALFAILLWCLSGTAAAQEQALKVSDNFARIAIGGTQTIRVTGVSLPEVKAASSNPSIATVSRIPAGFEIKAVAVGHAIVSITKGVEMENVDVMVRPYAAAFPQTFTATVTGSPATPATVKRAINTVLNNKVKAAMNAHWTFNTPDCNPLPSGTSSEYSIHVWASAPDTFPSAGQVKVIVKNDALQKQPDDALWYSNNPETVRQAGSLFSASLKKGAGARVLYHHVNGTSDDVYVRVEAINESDAPAKVRIIPGDSKPEKDPVRAGVNAAEQFISNWLSGSGQVLTIPPQSVLPISLRRLEPGETGSGLCSLRLLDGPSDLLVRVDAFPPLRLDDRWENVLYNSAAWEEVGTHPINDFDRAPCEANDHIYPNPYATETVTYEVGGRQGVCRIGQKPIAQLDAAGALDGNFGVLYTIDGSITNPTSTPADVELVFEASAGYSGGLFVINGNTIKTKVLAPKGKLRLATFHLAAGAVQSLKITTIPLSGSSYPATLTIRPITEETTAEMVKPGRA